MMNCSSADAREGRDVTQRACAMLMGLVLLWAGNFVWADTSVLRTPEVIRATDLPWEAQQTLALIKQGGPFPFDRDGSVFSNRERLLPQAARGTYREYTVKTPGRRDRGARRIVAAHAMKSGATGSRNPPASGAMQYWYTADHYRSFKRIVE